MGRPEDGESGAAEPASEELAEAGVYPTEQAVFEHGLVVLALGRPCWLIPGPASWRLLVEREALPAVAEQLASFDRESVGWPPEPVHERGGGRPADFITPLLWVLTEEAAYGLQGLWPGRLEAWGSLDARAVFDRGEGWRPLTALWLHADLGHLLSNTLLGYLVLVSVFSTLGRRRGGLLLLLAAYAGNLAAAAMRYPQPYDSLGASTAVFAGLGLLMGDTLRNALRFGGRHGWRGVFVPFASGITLLALYGAGGPRVDVIAHATGFQGGLALGFVAAKIRSRSA